MNAELSTDPQAGADRSATTTAIRPFYWSVRRELWENSSIYIAPLIVAAVQIFALGMSTIGIAQRRTALLQLNDPVKIRHGIEQAYALAAMMMIFTIFVVGIFYALDALHGERRDRSILFWKSLPVSDLTTVLSKLVVPLVILPIIAFVLVMVVQVAMLLITSAVLGVHGVSPATTWEHVPFAFNWFVLAYGLAAIALWLAPMYGWLFLVSGWVRRAAFLWAFLPWLVLCMFERLTFGTNYLPQFLKYRLTGFGPGAFDSLGQKDPYIDHLAQLTPLRYLASPGLWIGLIAAALLVGAAIRLRRYRGPL